MGYMGFGMRKADWERKPKEAFKKATELYGNTLADLPKVELPEGPVSTDFDELARLPRLHKRRFHLGAHISGIIFGLGMLLLLILLYLAMMRG